MRWTRAGASSLAAAAIAALVYGATLAPTVGAGDSGELVLAADSLSVPHPPGYPLWLLLARMAALAPFGAVAWRVNALSALLSAAAVGLFYLLAVRLSLPRREAALATAFFGASTLVWRSAVEAEVYPLATLFFVGLCLLALRARSGPSPSPRADALFFFAAGLSPLAHQTLAFPAALLAFWVVASGAKSGRLVRAAGWAALGFTLFFFLPLRAGAGPAYSWDQERGVAAAVNHFLRRNYGGLHQNAFRLDLVLSELAGMGALVVKGLGIPAALLASWGLFRIRHAVPGFRFVLLSAATIPAALAGLLVFTPDAEHFAQVTPFLAPVAAALCLAAGFGAAAVMRRAPGGWRVGVASALGACALLTVVVHSRACDRTAFRLAERYGRDLVRDLPSGSTLILDGDNETFLAAYATRIEHLRPDVQLIHRRGYLFGDPYGLRGVPRSRWVEVAHEADLVRLERAERPIYYATPPADLSAAGVRFAAAGLVHRAARTRDDGGDATGAKLPDDPAWLPPRGGPGAPTFSRAGPSAGQRTRGDHHRPLHHGTGGGIARVCRDAPASGRHAREGRRKYGLGRSIRRPGG